MKKNFYIAFRLFKYLTIAYTIIFWVYLTYDDWNFWIEYGKEHWIDYLIIDFGYWFAYLIGLGIYYWGVASIIILLRELVLKIISKIET